MASHAPPRGFAENLPVERHHDVYATIDPTAAWSSKALSGKGVFITGASRGIGRATALTFAKAGAAVALAARSAAALDETEAAILKEVPGAQVRKYTVDVRDAAAVEAAVEGAAAAFGGLAAVIANAGIANSFDTAMDVRAADAWWRVFEINLFGVYATFRPAAKYLRESGGSFFSISSIGAQFRSHGGSEYQISKHALNRLMEFIVEENPSIKPFAIHPGAVDTDIVVDAKLKEKGIEFIDAPELPAATMLYLALGKADWLAGRYVDATWDLAQVEKEWKEKIVGKDLLVNKLDVVA